MLLEECDRSRAPVKVDEPHYPVFPDSSGLPTPNATRSSASA
ncbi:MAG: hypothetical protein IPK80_27710 [Nannocystis sp.]|nr:hypothetical protein [Nannocystis sp.]